MSNNAIHGFGQNRRTSGPLKPHPTTQTREQRALELLTEGKLQQAEAIYQQLIKAKTNNAHCYGNLAYIHNAKGDIDGAKLLLQQALQLKPNYPEALNSLGNIYSQQGQLQQAIKCYESALKFQPNSPEDIFYNLGISLHKSAQITQAIQAYSQAIAINPAHTHAHFNLGNAYQELQQWHEASAAYLKAIQLDPKKPESHYNLGLSQQKSRHFHASIQAYKTALKLKPSYIEAHINLGNTYKETGDYNSAKQHYQAALKINPEHVGTLNNLGLIYCQEKDWNDALNTYKRALKLNPSSTETLNNIGITLAHSGDHNNAIKEYQKALNHNPNHPDCLNNLGLSLQAIGKTQAAIERFQQAIQHKPDFADAHSNLGTAFAELGNFNAALENYSKCLKLNPNHPDGNNNLSISLLLNGNYQSGWTHYEWRHCTKHPSLPHAAASTERWNRPYLKSDEKLLIISEQGLGDTIQFMRYIPYLRKKGLDIQFCAQPKLHPLIQESGIHKNPLTPDEAKTITDRPWIPLLSIPGALGINSQQPLINEPYLRIDNHHIERWKSKLSTGGQTLIGIHWQGNPEAEKENLKGRSFPLSLFEQLNINDHQRLVSLQKGFGSEQLQQCQFLERFTENQNEINNSWGFVDTAAILLCCDLVITNDSAICHLAAGLGRPTWLMLQRIPDWRWELTGAQSFWYPSMRIFRQRKRNDWSNVIAEINLALSQNEANKNHLYTR